jgi:hypothetical protein
VKARQLHRLIDLPEAKRFRMMAQGLQLLAAYVETLDSDAIHLHHDGGLRSAEVLGGLADEEAAKVMVLLDIARAGWGDKSALSNAFRAFRDHLARGLYVGVYDGRPASLGEVRGYVDTLRPTLHLDGPNDIDWIFRNMILDRRESRLYVDLIADDEDRPSWTSPAHRDDYHLYSPDTPVIVDRAAHARDAAGRPSQRAGSHRHRGSVAGQ